MNGGYGLLLEKRNVLVRCRESVYMEGNLVLWFGCYVYPSPSQKVSPIGHTPIGLTLYGS